MAIELRMVAPNGFSWKPSVAGVIEWLEDHGARVICGYRWESFGSEDAICLLSFGHDGYHSGPHLCCFDDTEDAALGDER